MTHPAITLREKITLAKWTITDLAHDIGIGRSYLHQMISTHRRWSAGAARGVSMRLGMPEEEVWEMYQRWEFWKQLSRGK